MKKSSVGDSGLFKARTVFAVELHPSTSANVLDGVKEQLNALLLRYVDEFNSVLISYSNVEILTKKPVIHPYFPYFHLDVRADVLVFKPTPGMTLVGRVNHIGEDYISALVMGVFNVTIPARSVMQGLQFIREESKWVHESQPQHQIAEHSYIVFRVEDVRDHGGFFQITGSLRDPGNGAADFLYPGVKLPEPPTAEWEADAVIEDGFTEPAKTVGGPGAAAKANMEEGKKHGFAQQKGSADRAKAKDGSTTNGGSHRKDDKKRRRSSEVQEDPKGKRRRTDGMDKGGAGTGPSENGDTAIPQAANEEATAAAKTPGNDVVANGGAAGGVNSVKSNKEKNKGKDGASADKGKKDKDGRHDVADGQSLGKERDKDKGGDRNETKVRKDKPKSVSKEKDEGRDKAPDPTVAVAGAAATVASAAAPAAAGKAHMHELGIAGKALANGGVNAVLDEKVKAVVKEKEKDKKDSSKKGKDASKEGKESSKKDKDASKEGKESSKKDKDASKEGKESSKKDKDASKEGKESSKKDKDASKEGKESSKKDKDATKEGKESSKKGKDSSKKDKDSSKKDKDSSKKDKKSSKKDKEGGGKADGIKGLQENGGV